MVKKSEEVVSQFYCENCSVRTKAVGIEKEVHFLRGWVGALAKKIDKAQVGLIAILLGVVVNLLLYIFNTPSKKEIAAAVLDAISNGVKR